MTSPLVALFLPGMGGMEWVVIGLGVILLFGGKKIPELMKGLGSGIKEFKQASKPDDVNSVDSNSDKKEN
ncbi:twin-arginine translocase TatA/TatE family subunit [Candidatus Kapabacteria bacterium]|nr:twin-arginine translocase TatA/TatE family subunit [Candidatus Kapabacteria bacterium]